MVKADELIRIQREKNDKKKKTFNKIYNNIEKKLLWLALQIQIIYGVKSLNIY